MTHEIKCPACGFSFALPREVEVQVELALHKKLAEDDITFIRSLHPEIHDEFEEGGDPQSK